MSALSESMRGICILASYLLRRLLGCSVVQYSVGPRAHAWGYNSPQNPLERAAPVAPRVSKGTVRACKNKGIEYAVTTFFWAGSALRISRASEESWFYRSRGADARDRDRSQHRNLQRRKRRVAAAPAIS